MRTIYDTILWLQSSKDEKPFPIVRFSADTEMATEGWVSLTSIERSEIVVAQLTGEEYRATFEGTEGYLQLERRTNHALSRSDLKCSWLVRVEQPEQTGKNSSFMAFYNERLPKLLYRDIFRNDILAEVISIVSLSEFEQGGGKLMVLK
jgi:hypothetical protein